MRREGYAGRISLIGAETHWPPFDRPPLSKQFLTGKWGQDRVVLRTDLDPGVDTNLEVRLGSRAIDLDLGERRLELDDGTHVDFDGLIVATGTTPRTLPGVQEVRGVHVLRTIDDCVALRADLGGPASVAVIGAGFIGCEVAAACRTLGHPVTIVEPLPNPLVRVLGPAIGEMVADLHREHGVELHLGAAVAGIDGVERVSGVRMVNDDLVKADVVVVGIGVEPATSWLEGAGLVIDNGVVCDSSLLAVGREGVAVAGDVARWPHPLFGGNLMRIEHWTNATEQGEHAARSLLAWAAGEEPEPFETVPYFWSDQYDVKLQMIGTRADGDDEHVVEGDPLGPERKGVIAFVREGIVVGALCVRRPNRTLAWRQHVANRARWPVPA